MTTIQVQKKNTHQFGANCNNYHSSPEEKHTPKGRVFDTDGSNNTKILHFNN